VYTSQSFIDEIKRDNEDIQSTEPSLTGVVLVVEMACVCACVCVCVCVRA